MKAYLKTDGRDWGLYSKGHIHKEPHNKWLHSPYIMYGYTVAVRLDGYGFQNWEVISRHHVPGTYYNSPHQILILRMPEEQRKAVQVICTTDGLEVHNQELTSFPQYEFHFKTNGKAFEVWIEDMDKGDVLDCKKTWFQVGGIGNGVNLEESSSLVWSIETLSPLHENWTLCYSEHRQGMGITPPKKIVSELMQSTVLGLISLLGSNRFGLYCRRPDLYELFMDAEEALV